MTDRIAPGTRTGAGWRRWPFVSLAVGAAASGLFALGVPASGLAYQPADPKLLDLLTCHLVHFSPTHFRWDLCTFLVVSMLGERRDRRRLLAFFAAAACLIPPIACAASGWVSHYGGLSGLVIGQAAMWLARDMRRGPSAWPAILLTLLFVKQVYECAIGDTSIIAIDYRGLRTVPSAHLLSAITGAGVGVLRPWSGPDRGPHRSAAQGGVADLTR